MTVTFDTVTLMNASPDEPAFAIRATERILIDGKSKVVSAANYGRRFRFTCMTEDFGDITDLLAKVGAPYTLTIHGTAYTNSYLSNQVQVRAVPGNLSAWTYTCELIQDTTS